MTILPICQEIQLHNQYDDAQLKLRWIFSSLSSGSSLLEMSALELYVAKTSAYFLSSSSYFITFSKSNLITARLSTDSLLFAVSPEQHTSKRTFLK